MKIITRMLLLASHLTIAEPLYLAFSVTNKHGIDLASLYSNTQQNKRIPQNQNVP